MIQCEKCGSDRTEQSDTRQRPNTLYVWRRRTCKSCGYKFTTREYRLGDLTKLINEVLKFCVQHYQYVHLSLCYDHACT